MSRRQCMRAALGFFSIAAFGIGASAGIIRFGNRLPGLDAGWLLELLIVLYGIVGMTGLGAGVYLTMKAVFKPRAVSLQPSLQYLKEYVAEDGRRRVRLTENVDGSILVSAQCLEGSDRRAAWGSPRTVAEAVSLPEAEALALEEAGYLLRRRQNT